MDKLAKIGIGFAAGVLAGLLVYVLLPRKEEEEMPLPREGRKVIPFPLWRRR